MNPVMLVACLLHSVEVVTANIPHLSDRDKRARFLVRPELLLKSFLLFVNPGIGTSANLTILLWAHGQVAAPTDTVSFVS